MEIPYKILPDGFKMPVFGLGTSGYGEGNKNSDKEQVDAIVRAIDAGITHIDTAEVYANGRSEILIGNAIRNFDRSKLFISTKVAYDNLSFSGVQRSLNGSLERLGTDYIDLYMVHRPNPSIPIIETMTALKEAQEKGLIRAIGVSNFNVEELRQAEDVLPGVNIAAGQYHYSLKTREAQEKGVIDYLQRHNKMLIAWRPVDKGRLAFSDADIMRRMIQKYSKTPSQIAINWLISQKNTVTLSRMSTKEHLEENLGAIGWQLDDSDVNELLLNFPEQESISKVVPLG